MKVKKYVADDFQTAFKLARKEMGPDAIILNSRQVKKGGFFGFFAKSRVEITVALDDDLRINRDKLRYGSADKKEDQLVTSNMAATSEKEEQLLLEMSKMNNIMSEIKGKMYELDQIKGISTPILPFYQLLVDNHVYEEIALRVANKAESMIPDGKSSDYEAVKEAGLRALQDLLNEVQPIVSSRGEKARVVVMVGPTGVGKTTTIAKLAANLTFADSRQVALITLDTYRVSAAEQLRTFAEIIGVPIKIVFSPADLEEAIISYLDKDVIFIDTAGRSPFNQEHMEELRDFLNIAKADETILVLSVNTASPDIINIYERFNRVGVDKLIFTKLDETDRYGQIINAIGEIKKPLAYFTTGQNVPDDIEVPNPHKFARMVLGKDEAL